MLCVAALVSAAKAQCAPTWLANGGLSGADSAVLSTVAGIPMGPVRCTRALPSAALSGSPARRTRRPAGALEVPEEQPRAIATATDGEVESDLIAITDISP